MRGEDDEPVRIRTPVDTPACPTVGANCRRLVTADAMGMAKEGDRTGVDVDGSGSENGNKHGKHHDVPRFGALRRENTPSPAEPTISNNSGYNEGSLSCMRGWRRGPRVTTLSWLCLCRWKCNNYGAVVVVHAGGVPGVLIGRTQGTKVNTHWR